MRTTTALLSCCLFGCSAHPGAPTPPTTTLALTHVSIVDVTGGPRLTDMTVVITGNRIRTIAPSDSAVLPEAAVVLNARYKFLIPGLWDMHVHAAWPGMSQPLGELFVANGVTGVRDMWGDAAEIAHWHSRVARFDARTPRLVAAGNLLDGPEPVGPNSIRVSTPDAARRTVDRLKRQGVEFIKVYSQLPREVYFAIAAEARRTGIPFAGHVPVAVSAAEASDSGQRSIEHLTGVTLACSAHGDDVQRRITGVVAERGYTAASALARREEAELAADYDVGRCRELAERFARNGTWQVPTLTVLHHQAYRDDSTLRYDPRLRWIPLFIRQRWPTRLDPTAIGAADDAARHALYRRQLMIVGLLQSAGVPILAGTDELNPYSLAGFSLHDELERLVAAGLTPLEALQTATLNPANFLGAIDSSGTVAAGKLADLVLLDGDPLADIRNTARIYAVVMNGRLVDGAARQQLLTDASRAEGRPRRVPPTRTATGARRPGSTTREP
jgi:imidazolonepropionase-like amidohydrolase